MRSLKRWEAVLFDVHVTQFIDAWIDLDNIPEWEEFAEQLPELVDDLVTFAERLEEVLLKAPEPAPMQPPVHATGRPV